MERRGGGAGREGGRVEGGGASSLQSHLGFFSQVVLISGAHVCESMNLRRHKVSAQQSQLASLLFLCFLLFLLNVAKETFLSSVMDESGYFLSVLPLRSEYVEISDSLSGGRGGSLN